MRAGRGAADTAPSSSASTSSSLDVTQFLRPADTSAAAMHAQDESSTAESATTSEHDHTAQDNGGWTAGAGNTTAGGIPQGGYSSTSFIIHQPAALAGQVASYLPLGTSYTHAIPIGQAAESHSRGSHPRLHPQQQHQQQQQQQQERDQQTMTTREYSVSDSVTSSGTSSAAGYQDYSLPVASGSNGVISGEGKGKGRALSGETEGVILGHELGMPDTTTKPSSSHARHHRRTTSSASRKTDDSASYPAEFTAQLLTGLSKRPAPQKTTTLTVSGKKQNLPPSAYPHLRPGDTVTDPNTPHIHGCPYCNKVYRGQHARSICRRHQMSKHGIELEVQVKKSRWDNNPNRPATEQEKHQRTLESKRRWAAKDRKRRRCAKLGITYISSSDEGASGSSEEDGTGEDDGDSVYNAVAGPSTGRRLAATGGSAGRSARSASRGSSTPGNGTTPEVAADHPTTAGKVGRKPTMTARRGSSALHQVVYPEDEEERHVGSSRRAGKGRAAEGEKQAAAAAGELTSRRSGAKKVSTAATTHPFSNAPLMEPLVIVKTEDEALGQPKQRRKRATSASRRATTTVEVQQVVVVDSQRQYMPAPTTALVNGGNGQHHVPVAMVPTQSRPSQAIVYQQPMSDAAPVFMNIPEGARVYAVQYRDDPRTGYRVVSAPQPVQFFMPSGAAATVGPSGLPLRPNSAPPEDLMLRSTHNQSIVIPAGEMLSPVILQASDMPTAPTTAAGLAPAVTLRPEPMRRVTSLQQFPPPIASPEVDVFSSRPSAAVGSTMLARAEDSEENLMRAAIRRSSADAPSTEPTNGDKPASSQDSDSNEEAAEILLAFSNSPARSVTASSSKKHARHQSMDTGLPSAKVHESGNGHALVVGSGSSRLQDITTGLQTNTTTTTAASIDLDVEAMATNGEEHVEDDDATPIASRTRPVKPPPLRPPSEEMPFQRANLWPGGRSVMTAVPKPLNNDDPFRVPETMSKRREGGAGSAVAGAGELAPSAYIMAPPPRPARMIPASTNAALLSFRQPKDVIPSSGTNRSGLSSPPEAEPHGLRGMPSSSAGPTPRHSSSSSSALRNGPTPRIALATPARRDWVASSPALGHPFSSPSGLDLTHKLGLAATDVSTVPDSPSWLELVRATPDAKSKRNRGESSDGEMGAEGTDNETPGKRLRL
ncbi:hypothetical protein QFC19_008599 [Naganishia cerealis]|uniref:Uncharacterized protein n=1 Tax=Naganishia cerealis TaxID=610337 RepID=A0ACC2V2A1_9TREE|nr:hypothetical protein QFC19_008599 [Naganishia cerealis]